MTSYEANTEMDYRGYVIEARPNKRRDTGRWTTNINILVGSENGITAKPYRAQNTYASEVEAIDGCFSFGKSIIDGTIAGLAPPPRT